MRRLAVALCATGLALTLAGCRDDAQSIGAVDYSYDPVCDVGPITVDAITYAVTALNSVGSHAPAPDPTLGPNPNQGVLERFNDGTATWTGNGYEVRFDAHADEGLSQVC